MTTEGIEKKSWDAYFAEHTTTKHSRATSPEAFLASYEGELAPFYLGGYERGFVFKSAVDALLLACAARGVPPRSLKILEVGSGYGDLSVYLSIKGFDVTGIDLAETSKAVGEQLAAKFGATCRFVSTSIEKTPFPDEHFDFVIGLASLHHFIKHPQGAIELRRIMKPGALGFFSDPFHENPMYRLFHNKAEMKRLGDELMTRRKVYGYFSNFKVEIIPIDWFVMFDKLFLFALGDRRDRFVKFLRTPSRYLFQLDRRMPTDSSVALFFSGGIVTKITK